jgi:hypothetical protein
LPQHSGSHPETGCCGWGSDPSGSSSCYSLVVEPTPCSAQPTGDHPADEIAFIIEDLNPAVSFGRRSRSATPSERPDRHRIARRWVQDVPNLFNEVISHVEDFRSGFVDNMTENIVAVTQINRDLQCFEPGCA